MVCRTMDVNWTRNFSFTVSVWFKGVPVHPQLSSIAKTTAHAQTKILLIAHAQKDSLGKYVIRS